MIARHSIALASLTMLLTSCCLEIGGAASTSGGFATSGGQCLKPLPAIPAIHRPAPVTCPTFSYECQQDPDCTLDGGPRVCSCAPNGAGFASNGPNVCLGGDCLIDADCACGYCSPSQPAYCPYRGYLGFYCHTPADSCINDSDCDAGYCGFSEMVDHWVCTRGFCAG